MSGERAALLGGACTALSGDVSEGNYNPSALAYIKRNRIISDTITNHNPRSISILALVTESISAVSTLISLRKSS